MSAVSAWLVAALIAVAWAVRELLRRPPPVVTDAKRDAEAARQAADVQANKVAIDAAAERARAEAEAERRANEDRARDPVDVANDIIRRRTGGALLLALALLPAPARAECRHGPDATVVCDAPGFEQLVAEAVDQRERADKAVARAVELDTLLAAERARCAAVAQVDARRIATLEQALNASRLQWLAGGVAAGVVLGLVVAAVVR